MSKQLSLFQKYLDDKYPLAENWRISQSMNYLQMRKIATEAYEFALQQPLPPTPELQQMLDEKFPITGDYEPYKDFIENDRKTFTEGYLAGQSSLKQDTKT